MNFQSSSTPHRDNYEGDRIEQHKTKAVFMGKPQNVFGLSPNPKNSPEGPEKCKKAQNLAEIKTKRYGYTSKTKVDSLH